MNINNRIICVVCRDFRLAMSVILNEMELYVDTEKVLIDTTFGHANICINGYKIIFKTDINSNDRGCKFYVVYIDNKIKISSEKNNMIGSWVIPSSNNRPIRLCDFENGIGIDIADLLFLDEE